MDVNAKANVEGSLNAKIERLKPELRGRFAELVEEADRRLAQDAAFRRQVAVDLAKARIVLEHGASAYTIEDMGVVSSGGKPVAAAAERIKRNNATALENERRFKDEQDRRG